MRLYLAGLAAAAALLAQAPADSSSPAASMKQLMVDLIHPASNEILLSIFRGGPKNEAEWAMVRRGALTLAEAGDVLRARGPNQDAWLKDARLLADAGAAAYKAAQAKNARALAAVADSLDAACTTCHKQYRPNVFPREGSSK